MSLRRPVGHIAMEEFFKWQLSTHGHVGSLGPGWNMEADPVLGLEPARDGDRFAEKGSHTGLPCVVHNKSDDSSMENDDSSLENHDFCVTGRWFVSTCQAEKVRAR